MRLPFGLIRGGGISWRLPFGLRRVELKSASSTGSWLAITELKLDPCAASSCLVGDGRGTGSTADCESVEDDRRLSHQLDSSSRMEAGEGGYSSPMDASEFDSASRSDKEAGSSSSRATEADIDSASCPLAKVVDSVSPSVVEVVDSL